MIDDHICLDTIQEVSQSAIAIYFYNDDISEVTYGELAKKIDKAMQLLRKLMHPGDLAVLCYPRCIEILVMMMACLCSHIPFLFIDPATPQKRFQKILEQTGARFVFTTKPINLQIIHQISFDKNEYVYESETFHPIRWEEVAYLLYTSGTTGEPKCVVIPRKSLLQFEANIGRHLSFYNYKSVLASTSLSFDISLLETIIPLLHGQIVYLLSEKYISNPKSMIRFIENNSVDIVQFTPSHLRFFSMYSKRNFTFLKHVKILLIGGEQFPIELYNSISNGTQAIIYNMYGPTEATIWCSCKKITDCGDNSIGNPLQGCLFSIRDINGNVVKDGECGELYIAGEQVALGYTDDLMTSKRFIRRDGLWLYKTGDLALHDPVGEYQILGRIDNQIKHNGHRIELDEITEQILQICGILHCYIKKEGNDLCCYYFCESLITPKKIVAKLKEVLPHYMIPTRYYKLNQVHLSPNGKLIHCSVDEKKHIQK